MANKLYLCNVKRKAIDKSISVYQNPYYNITIVIDGNINEGLLHHTLLT